MPYTFLGRLCGYLCDECDEPLSNVTVRLYRAAADQSLASRAAASPKDTLALLDDQAVEAKAESLLAEAETDEDGGFEFQLEDGAYEGGPVEVDVLCRTVPGGEAAEHAAEPIAFSITTLQPEWRRRGDRLVAYWTHCLPDRFWCMIHARFGIWVICGRVETCDTHVAVPGATISAFDVDWLQDDPLGSAVTDGSGRFRIYYSRAAFEKTPFSPFINIEWTGGPDVYFKGEYGGITVLDEPRSKGRTPGRDNVGPCLCVDLCVDLTLGPPVQNPWFTNVGDFDIQSDFAASGLTNKAVGGHGGPDFGFFDGLKLKGYCPKVSPADNTTPMVYRFRYEDTANPGLVPITPDLVFPVQVGSRQIQWNEKTLAGLASSTLTWTFQAVWIQGSGATPGTPAPLAAGAPWTGPPAHVIVPDGNGWIAVDQNGLDTGFYGPLIGFNTTAPSVVPGGASPGNGAGNAVASPENGKTLRIVFEATRKVGSNPPVTPADFSNSLDAISVNNWEEVALLDLQQFHGTGATACSPLTNALDILYTVDHERLGSFSIGLTTAATPKPTDTYPQGAGPRGGHGTDHHAIGTWPSCSYTVSLSRVRALTTGEVDDSGRTTSVTFCK